VASAFNGSCQLTLVLGANARLPAWSDFSIVGDIAAEDINLLIVNGAAFFSTKLALSRPGKKTPLPALGIV
jgi:hypothetical protein